VISFKQLRSRLALDLAANPPAVSDLGPCRTRGYDLDRAWPDAWAELDGRKEMPHGPRTLDDMLLKALEGGGPATVGDILKHFERRVHVSDWKSCGCVA
jgi:hypothetical protein